MSTLKIKEALANVGINATEVEVVKNGIQVTGYQLETGTNIKPVIYYTGEDIDNFMLKAKEVLAKEQPIFDIDQLISRESLLNNSYICLQKKGDEDILKRDYLNLEMFVRVSVNHDDCSEATIKIRKDIIDMAHVSEDELFEAAISNSINKVTICSMSEALGLPEAFCDDMPMYIGSYINKIHGAAILALPEVLHNFCIAKGIDQVYILPSSTEEVIIVTDSNMNVMDMASMVNEVNFAEVEPILRLDPVVYRYSEDTQIVEIAAAYEEV